MATQIMIAGGGIGGLTAGVALAQAGHEVRVFERAGALRAAGAGITMQSNAMLVFERLGLADAVREAGRVIEGAAITDARGRVLQSSALGPVAEALGQPSVAVHRGALLELLAEAARAAGVQIEVGAGVGGFEARGERVVALLGDGAALAPRSSWRLVLAPQSSWLSLRSNPRTALGLARAQGLIARSQSTSPSTHGDVLVGADGLHSAVRRALRGEEPVRYAGYTSWRGVSRYAAPERGGQTWEAWGRGQRFGIVPIGGGLTYWFATQDAPPGERDGADARGELLARFEGWFEEVGALIRATDEIIRTDISDRAPISGDWGAGRVTLLGDAAHPMTPNMGQGGGQAVEDAWALAQALRGAVGDGGQLFDVAGALRGYERGRAGRAAMFVERSRSIGRVAQWSAAPACWLRDGLMGMVPSKVATRQMIEVLGGVQEL
jgi:2-polyprenyl-6-methoxyphenol hydroxylase-like FAD-dependent oxidoreductase